MTDELEQMSPNQRRALDKALSALETFAAIWAAEIRLSAMSARIAAVPSEAERAKRIAAMIEQGFIEGAYRHYLDHKDKCDELEAARATAEQSTEATVPYSLYVAGCRDFERVAARCDDAAEIIAALQKALAYWMPKVFDDRSAHDAYLLMGYKGEDEPAFWDTHPSRDSVIEECCAAIKAKDDLAADDNYMLDSNDCIKVCRALKSQQDAAITTTGKTS
jgi:hypothetical protein